jgi:hypothetical protein
VRGAMESVTRMALQEMITAHASTSKFGYILSEDSMGELIDTLYEFFETSRNLKAAGDRMIQGNPQGASYKSTLPRPGR